MNAQTQPPGQPIPPKVRRATDSFKVGEKDTQGLEIARIYSSSPEYVVYRTAIGIRVFTDEDDKPSENRTYFKRFLEIGPELGRIYSLQPDQIEDVESINRQLARGMQQCLEGHLENAKQLLKEAESRLIRLRMLGGRLGYLLGAGCTLAIAIVINILIAKTGYFDQVEISYSQVIACGAMGGFLSVAIGIWKLEIDLDASQLINILTGASRILIASLAALISLFAVRSNIALGTLNFASAYSIFIVATLSGFSEKFIPNILSKITPDNDKV